MSRNVYIWWDDHVVNAHPNERIPLLVGAKKDMPGKDAVRLVVREYFDTFPCDIEPGGEENEWTTITFPSSFTKFYETFQRRIEVHVGVECVNVITRDMDAITNAIAMGLGRLISQRFKGRYDDQ